MVAKKLFGNVGRPVALDVSSSFGAGDPRFAFAWAIVQQPPASTAKVTAPTTTKTTFTPDVAGTYRVRLTVSDGDAGFATDIPVTVWSAVQILPYLPVDAEYDRQLDRLVLISNDPPTLHLYDAFSTTDVGIALPLEAARSA